MAGPFSASRGQQEERVLLKMGDLKFCSASRSRKPGDYELGAAEGGHTALHSRCQVRNLWRESKEGLQSTLDLESPSPH